MVSRGLVYLTPFLCVAAVELAVIPSTLQNNLPTFLNRAADGVDNVAEAARHVANAARTTAEQMAAKNPAKQVDQVPPTSSTIGEAEAGVHPRDQKQAESTHPSMETSIPGHEQIRRIAQQMWLKDKPVNDLFDGVWENAIEKVGRQSGGYPWLDQIKLVHKESGAELLLAAREWVLWAAHGSVYGGPWWKPDGWSLGGVSRGSATYHYVECNGKPLHPSEVCDVAPCTDYKVIYKFAKFRPIVIDNLAVD